jgi:hypothetical protein
MNKIFDISPDEVFSMCKTALENLEISIDESKSHIIYGSTKSTIWSWGETIEISVNSFSTKKCRIEVVSKSKAQLIDWGKNEENEKRIMNMIDKLVSR